MAGAVVIGGAAIAVASTWGHGTWPLAVAFACAWFVSPVVVLRASLSPRVAGRRPLVEGDAHSLRLVARRTWRFFEAFVTSGDNSLPPDNFQEAPEPAAARPSVLPASRHIQFDELQRLLGSEVGMANEEQIETLFIDCEPGSVPALGAAYGLNVIVDDSLAQQPDIYFEGG
ncbi:MAG: YbaK/EbsC family protein [Candidatus Binataceae bacterium]